MTNNKVSNVLFLSVFGQEHVEILTVMGGAPVTFIGYLIDVDARYLYLGADKDNITQAIKHIDVRTIQLFNEKAQIQKHLEDMPVPTNPKEIN